MPATTVLSFWVAPERVAKVRSWFTSISTYTSTVTTCSTVHDMFTVLSLRLSCNQISSFVFFFHFNKPTKLAAHFELTCHQWTVSAASSCGQCIRSADPCLTQLPADANQTLTLIRPDLDWAKTVRNRGSQVNVVDASSLKHDGASERFQSMLICFLCVLQTEADFSRKSQARAAHFCWSQSKEFLFWSLEQFPLTDADVFKFFICTCKNAQPQYPAYTVILIFLCLKKGTGLNIMWALIHRNHECKCRCLEIAAE